MKTVRVLVLVIATLLFGACGGGVISPYQSNGERIYFTATDEHGSPLPPEALPLVIALQKHQAAHRAFWIRGLDGRSRKIQATAFPLEGHGGRHLGAVAIFWEESRS